MRLTEWSFEPWVVAILAGTTTIYLVGLVRLWRSAGFGKGIRRWQVLTFLSGVAALIVALLSPLDALGEILFSAHMAQHEILMVVAAPLLVISRPMLAVLWAMPAAWRTPVSRAAQNRPVSAAWHVATAAPVAVLAHAIALWVWHLPSLYQATLHHEGIHALQHISFVGTAALFWWSLIHGRMGRLGYGAAVLWVFITSMHSGALGALLTFSPNLWYPIYAASTRAWGLDPIEDQQLAGLIMWVPAGVILVVLGVTLFCAWLAESGRRVELAERTAAAGTMEKS